MWYGVVVTYLSSEVKIADLNSVSSNQWSNAIVPLSEALKGYCPCDKCTVITVPLD